MRARLLVLGLLCGLIALATAAASYAATPAAGTVSQAAPSSSWGGGPFLTSNPSGLCFAVDPSCDTYALTIVPPATGNYTVEITTTPSSEGDDYDLFVNGPTGSRVGSSTTPTGHEKVVLTNPPAGTYSVSTLAWLVTPGGTYTGAAKLAVGSAPPPADPGSVLYEYDPSAAQATVEVPLRVVAVGFAPGELDEAKVLGEIPNYQRPGVLIPRGQSSSGDQNPLFGVETLVNHGRNYYNDSKPYTVPYEYTWKPKLIYASSQFTSGLFNAMKANSTTGDFAKSGNRQFLEGYNSTRGAHRGTGALVKPNAPVRFVDGEKVEDWIAANSKAMLGWDDPARGKGPGRNPGYTGSGGREPPLPRLPDRSHRRNLLKKTWIAAVAAAVLAASALAGLAGAVPNATSSSAGSERYLVVLAGVQGETGFEGTGTAAAVSTAVAAAGGTVVNDLSTQIGVLVAEAAASGFAAALSSSSLVETVGKDAKFKGLPDGGPEQTADPLESLQWDMAQIRAPQAHNFQAGARSVDVGVLDSGIDGRHPDFFVDGPGASSRGTNVDCARGRNSVSFLPSGPGVGNPDPCTDNQFHGTHVAGTIAAQANGIGVVGVAPNVTLVPVKVCDASGYCYVSAVVDGITYAGDIRLDVINMSFFVDNDAFQESTEFKCNSDPTQRAFRQSVERAIKYAIGRGVVPVAALGNSDEDLGDPSEADGADCDVVPAETKGVIAVSALGPQSEKSSYSNYGAPANDIAAPGGNGTTGDCRTTILSTLPGGAYGCIQGTSMAAPHTAGVAALIVSQFGKLAANGDVELAPSTVESIMERSAVDLGLTGYDTCFGNGRIDALRAIERDFSTRHDASAPFCAESTE